MLNYRLSIRNDLRKILEEPEKPRRIQSPTVPSYFIACWFFDPILCL